jgi:hypothetical protein
VLYVLAGPISASLNRWSVAGAGAVVRDALLDIYRRLSMDVSPEVRSYIPILVPPWRAQDQSIPDRGIPKRHRTISSTFSRPPFRTADWAQHHTACDCPDRLNKGTDGMVVPGVVPTTRNASAMSEDREAVQ